VRGTGDVAVEDAAAADGTLTPAIDGSPACVSAVPTQNGSSVQSRIVDLMSPSEVGRKPLD
jgi:hypothetical protein